MFLCDQVICFDLFDTQNQWFSFHGSRFIENHSQGYHALMIQHKYF